jgi:hypothetical protein
MVDGLKERLGKSWVKRVRDGDSLDIDDNKRLKNINELELILSRAASGNATPEDLAKARKLNELLGGEFSGLIAEVERMVERAEEIKHLNSKPMEQNIDPVTSADNYFDREEVKIARKAIEEIEGGKEVSDSIFVRMMKYLTSGKEVDLRAKALDKLEKEKEAIVAKIIVSGVIKKKDIDKFMKINKQIISLTGDEKKAEVVKAIILDVEEAKILLKKSDVCKGLLDHKPQHVKAKKEQNEFAAKELEDILRVTTELHKDEVKGKAEPSKEEKGKAEPSKEEKGKAEPSKEEKGKAEPDKESSSKVVDARKLADKQAALEKAHAIMKEATKKRRAAVGLKPTKNEEKEKAKKEDLDFGIGADQEIRKEDRALSKSNDKSKVESKWATKRDKKNVLPQALKGVLLDEGKNIIKPSNTPVVKKKPTSFIGIG